MRVHHLQTEEANTRHAGQPGWLARQTTSPRVRRLRATQPVVKISKTKCEFTKRITHILRTHGSIPLAQLKECRLPFLGSMLRWEHFTRTTEGKLCLYKVSILANEGRNQNINLKGDVRAQTFSIFNRLSTSPAKLLNGWLS